LSKIIIVDNIPHNYAAQPENGICIKEWRGDRMTGDEQISSLGEDTALEDLARLLVAVVQEAEQNTGML